MEVTQVPPRPHPPTSDYVIRLTETEARGLSLILGKRPYGGDMGQLYVALSGELRRPIF